MTKELDTLLTGLYVLVDDCVITPRRGRGRRPELTDSELLTLAVAQVLLGYHGERRWVRHLHADPDWRALFPYLPGQSGYHKRLKGAHALLGKAILTLAAACPSWFDDMWITDATPVPCGTSRETVKRSDLAGHAGYGYCASHSRFYWGFKLYLVCAGDGMPITELLGLVDDADAPQVLALAPSAGLPRRHPRRGARRHRPRHRRRGRTRPHRGYLRPPRPRRAPRRPSHEIRAPPR